jgi:hypothetical protein
MKAGTVDPQDRITFEIASEHATTRVPMARPTDSAGELRRSLLGQTYDCASHIAVCEGGRFVGVLRIEDLIASRDDRTVASLMDRDAPTVAPGVDHEVAAWRAVQHGESALSVVGKDGRFEGIIPPHRLLAVLLQEHDEDMARLGGFLKGSSKARRASEEPVHRRFLAPCALAAARARRRVTGCRYRRLVRGQFAPGPAFDLDLLRHRGGNSVKIDFEIDANRLDLQNAAIAGWLRGLAFDLPVFQMKEAT